MKEFDVALKAVAEGLRTIAQGMEKIAGKLEDSVPKKQSKTKPKKTADRKPAPKKAAPKKAPAAKETAADTVLKIIAGSKKGVNSATLMEKTGFDKKKIANITFKLRKQGKIKSVDKGVYTKA
jgi:hypothetical protein